MAFLLRRPGNFARYSRTAAEYFARARPLPVSYPRPKFTSVIVSQRIRAYATNNPNGQKPPDGKPTQPESKNAPGVSETEGVGARPAQTPVSKLSLEEQADIELVISQIKAIESESRQHLADELRAILMEEGLPLEIRNYTKKYLRTGDMPSLKDIGVLPRYWVEQRSLLEMNMRRSSDESGSSGRRPEKDGEDSDQKRQDQEKSKDQEQQRDQKEQQGKKEAKEQEQQKKQQQKTPNFKGFEFRIEPANFLITSLIAYYIYRSLFPGENRKEITWQEFRGKFLDKGLVEKLTVINRDRVRVEVYRDAVASVYPDSPAAQPYFHYYFSIGSVDSFERRLDEAQIELGIPSSERIPVSYVDETPWAAHVLNLVPTVLLIGSFFWLSRRAGAGAGGQSGIFGIGKSRARRFNHETDIKIKFSDVAGMDEAKTEIMEFVSFLKQPEKFMKLGAKIPRGAILSGPPGTGKTLLAKATAGESGVPFFSVSGSEFVEMFVGVGPSRVRDLFANARKNTPCIIFIDEIDAIGKSRSKQSFGGGTDERESTLNQILTEMDGFNTTDQVVVLAGTNRPDVLDKALMRPGRFDRHIAIDRPTMDGRKQIFRVHLRKIVTSEDMDHLVGRLAALTPGFSGADIANCVNEAALVAARENANTVLVKHFEQAIERVVGGLERKSLVLSPEEKRVVAYHEAGHAICGWYFRWADPLLKVSIIPRGQGALGYAQYLPAGGDTYLMNVNQFMDRMAMTLGGRVSEELHFDTVTSGASDDFRKVTHMATAMVTKYGMSKKVGYVHYEEDPSSQFHKPFSEDTARNIDAEVRRIVDEAYKQCRDLLTEKKKEIGILADELLAKEVLTRDDIIRLLGPRPFPETGEFAQYFDGKRGQTLAPPDLPRPDESTEGKDGRDQTPLPI